MIKAPFILSLALLSGIAAFASWQAGESAPVATSAIASKAQCSQYVKPAACISHPECRWNGNCVPR